MYLAQQILAEQAKWGDKETIIGIVVVLAGLAVGWWLLGKIFK